MNLLNRLVERSLDDPYLRNLTTKLEYAYANSFAGNNYSEFLLTEKEYYDCLRFADILCHSKNYEARNISYKLISLLFPFYSSDIFFKTHAANVLTKLGNFPSLHIATENTEIEADEIAIDQIIKQSFQQAPDSEHTFTDSQYKVFEKMKDSNHFSFSGPTSFGKSFIFESFIKYLIDKRNGADNIALLVPTKALITQVSNQLKRVISHPKYKIISHPVVPSLYKQENYKFIFVFTPERLISYLSDSNPVINYLLVDEAHKVLSETDTRAPLFYHALMLAKRKSINLYFSSPNIPNTEIFLQLVGNSTEETLAIKETSVSQNRFFIDCIEKKSVFFSEFEGELVMDYAYYALSPQENLNQALLHLGKDHQNIIYCNTKDDTINYALGYAQNRPSIKDDDLNNLIKLVQETMHEEYFLIDCLKKGVAYHFGGLPQQIREMIELLFQQQKIKDILCTSTLLEGVNLPAKNIFILSNAIGLTKFSKIDFWNLAGRAGRLTKDLSGNIVCMRVEDKRNRWKNPEKDTKIIKDKLVDKTTSILMTNKKKFYENIGKTLISQPFTRQNVSENEKKMLESYGNILAYHALSKTDSILRSKFIDSNPNARHILSYLDISNQVPVDILAQSSTIKLKYQNKIFSEESQLLEVPTETTYQDCYILLSNLYDLYNWGEEESGGRSPLVRGRESLKYYAFLMNSWVNSTPLNTIIKNTIDYYQEQEKQIFIYDGPPIKFNRFNRAHINHIVNQTISDIEHALRFKIKLYVKNYSDLCATKRNSSAPKENTRNWENYLEYGTTDLTIIELQNLGFPRHLANFLKKNYLNFFQTENDVITSFDIDELLCTLRSSDFHQEYKEISLILGVPITS